MMKIKIITTLYLILGLSFFYGQKLEFKDKNFEKAVLENFDLNKTEYLNLWKLGQLQICSLFRKELLQQQICTFLKM